MREKGKSNDKLKRRKTTLMKNSYQITETQKQKKQSKEEKRK